MADELKVVYGPPPNDMDSLTDDPDAPDESDYLSDAQE